jgi:hypothetical protein
MPGKGIEVGKLILHFLENPVPGLARNKSGIKVV